MTFVPPADDCKYFLTSLAFVVTGKSSSLRVNGESVSTSGGRSNQSTHTGRKIHPVIVLGPFLQSLADECQGRNQHQDVLGLLSFSGPQRNQRLTSSAGHDQSSAVECLDAS